MTLLPVDQDMPRTSFGGAMMSVDALNYILKELNEHGRLCIVGIQPGTVNSLVLGAALSKLADLNIGKK